VKTIAALGQSHQGIDVLARQLASRRQFFKFFFHDIFSRPITIPPLLSCDGENPREIAIRVLRQRRPSGEYVEKLLDRELARHALSPPDRALCQELVYGMVRWQGTLDWLVARKTGGPRPKRLTAALLHLGLYQLFWLQRIPDHAAVHETVELAKRLGFGPRPDSSTPSCAVTSANANKQSKALEALKKPTRPRAIPIRRGWWNDGRPVGARRGRRNCWPGTTGPHHMYARLNELKTDAARLAARWQQEGVEFEEREWDWTGPNSVFELRGHPPLAALGSFQDGWFYVQDPSTLLAVRQLDPQPGETILDLCAAPGGKTMPYRPAHGQSRPDRGPRQPAGATQAAGGKLPPPRRDMRRNFRRAGRIRPDSY
jgi:16S rRNA (cytosine967-C5)-methyltransferase